MALKIGKDAYYFTHFCNARNDRKIRRARKELGIEAYAIYFMLLEVLREENDFRYPLSYVDVLAEDFGTSEQKINTLISKYGLFDIDEDGNFFSEKFIEYMSPYLSRSNTARKAAEARWQKGSAVVLPKQCDSNADAMLKQCDSNADAMPSKVKYSKVKDSIVKNSKVEESIVEDVENFRSNVLSILSYFNLTVENNPAQASLSFRFVRYLYENNTLDYFLKQFEAYQTYKSEANEYRHSLTKFIGDESEGYQNGGWNADNWIEKLAGIKQKNSAESDYDKKTREMVNKMSW